MKAERNRQLIAEQAEQEAAARAALETANAAARTGRRIAPHSAALARHLGVNHD